MITQDSTDTFVVFATKSLTGEADLQANNPLNLGESSPISLLQSGRALFRREDYNIVMITQDESMFQRWWPAAPAAAGAILDKNWIKQGTSIVSVVFKPGPATRKSVDIDDSSEWRQAVV